MGGDCWIGPPSWIAPDNPLKRIAALMPQSRHWRPTPLGRDETVVLSASGVHRPAGSGTGTAQTSKVSQDLQIQYDTQRS